MRILMISKYTARCRLRDVRAHAWDDCHIDWGEGLRYVQTTVIKVRNPDPRLTVVSMRLGTSFTVNRMVSEIERVTR